MSKLRDNNYHCRPLEVIQMPKKNQIAENVLLLPNVFAISSFAIIDENPSEDFRVVVGS